MNTIKKRALTSIAVCFMACLMFSMPVLAASNSFSKTTVKLNAISYWWGMSAGIVDVICSKHLPAGTQKLISVMTNLIREGAITPFSGKLTSQNGIVRNEDDGAMLHEDILKMDWLAENVVGMLPTEDDLVDEAKTVVALQGIDTPESLELKSVPEVK